MAELDRAALDAYFKGGAAPAQEPGTLLPAARRGYGALLTGAAGLSEFLGLPAPSLAEYGQKVIERAGPPRYELGDIFTSPLGTIGEITAEQLPLLATQLAAGLVSGGATVPAGVATVARGLAARGGMAAARRLAGGAIGEGAIAASTLGSIYAEQPEEEKDRLRALVTGVPSHFLERMGGEQLARRLMRGQVRRGAEERLLPFVARTGARTALIEGPFTEVPQTFLEQLGTGRPLDIREALEAGAKGAIAGGVIGSGLGMFTPRQRQDLQADIRDQTEQLKTEITGQPPAPRQVPPDVQLRFDLNRQLQEAGAVPQLLPEESRRAIAVAVTQDEDQARRLDERANAINRSIFNLSPTDPKYVAGQELIADLRLAAERARERARQRLAPPSRPATLADVREGLLPGFEIPEAPLSPRRRVPLPTIGEAINITQLPRRPPPPPGRRGMRVEELTPEEIAATERLDLAAVQQLPVEEIILGEETTPEAFAARRRAAIEQRAAELTGQPPTALAQAFQRARERAQGTAETAAQQQAREVAFAQAERDAEIARLLQEQELQRVGQRGRLEEAAAAIERGALPPQRFMRPDVDTLINRAVGEIVQTGGTARLPAGLRAKIYSALKLGQRTTNYGLQIVGLTKLLNSLDPRSKGYEVVGRLLDSLRGVSDAAQVQQAEQAAVARAGVQPTERAAVVPRPGERVSPIPTGGEQIGARDVTAAAGPRAAAETQIGERRGPSEQLVPGKPGRVRRARPVRAPSKPARVGPAAAEAAPRGPAEAAAPVEAAAAAAAAREGVARRAAEAEPRPARPGIPAVPSPTGVAPTAVRPQPRAAAAAAPEPAAERRAKPVPKARHAPAPAEKPKPAARAEADRGRARVAAKKPAVPSTASQLETKENPNAVRERSTTPLPVAETSQRRERVREQDAEKRRSTDARKAQRARDAKAKAQPLEVVKAQLAKELGVPISEVNDAFAPVEEPTAPARTKGIRQKRAKAAEVYTWKQPVTLQEAIKESPPVDYALSELRDLSEKLDIVNWYTRAWWYDLNWIRALIASKGESDALGKKLVNDPTQGGKLVPLWEWYSHNIRATPAQLEQSAEKVQQYERFDRNLIKRRQDINERQRQQEIAFREQLTREAEEAQAAARQQVTKVENRKARRAKLQPPKRAETAKALPRTEFLRAHALEDTARIGPSIQRMVVLAGEKGVPLPKLLQMIASRTANTYTRFFATLLQTVPMMSDVMVKAKEHHPIASERAEPWIGLFDPNDNTIYLHPDIDLVSGGMNPLTVLHEALHGATLHKIEIIRNFLDKHSAAKVGDVSISVPEFRGAVILAGTLNNAREAAKRNGVSERFEHELKDLHEFVAGAFTNVEFQNFLAGIELTTQQKRSISDVLQTPARSPVRSLWDQFVHGVQRLLGINPSSETTNVLEAIVRLTPALFNETKATREVGLQASKERLRRARAHVARSDIAARPSDVVENMGQVPKQVSKWLGDKGWIASLKGKVFDTALGWVTLFEMKEMFSRQFPQLNAYFDLKAKQQQLVTELNNEAGEMISRWERLNAKHGGWDVTKGRDHPITALYNIMSSATLAEYFPDKNIYEQPATERRTRAEADEWFKTEKGKEWLQNTESIRRQWQSLNGKDPALGKLFKEAYALNKKRYDQSARLFKSAIIENMFEGVFPADIQNKDIDTKERWLRDQLEIVKPSGVAPDVRMANVVQAVLRPLDALNARMAEVRGPYFHLGRFGPWGIRWVDDAGVVNMKRFENYGEFLEAVETFTSKGIHKRTVKEDGKDKAVWFAARFETNIKEFDQGSDRFLQSMMQKIDQQYVDDPARAKVLKQAIRQMYLQMLPDTAFFKVFQKRKGVPGWDQDMLRAYAHRMEIMNRTIGYNTFTRPLQQAIGEFRAVVEELGKAVEDRPTLEKAERGAAVIAEIRKREAEAIRQPDTPYVDLVTSVNYMFYLALSPAYVITNLTQPWLITMPFLGGRHGWVSSAKKLAATSKTAWGVMRSLIDSALLQSRGLDLATQLESAGRPTIAFEKMPFLSPQQKEFLSIVAAHGQLNLTLAHEVGAVAKVGGTSKFQKTKTIAGLMSHYSEMFNRISAGLAAFELEMQRTKDFDKAAAYGLKIVRRTQFDYSHANLARQMSKQGIFAKYTPLVMAFQRFNAQLLEAYTDTTLRAFGKLNEGLSPAEQKAEMAEARKTLAGMLGAAGMFAGLMGMPAANLIFAVLDKLFGSDDDPVDTKAQTRQWLADVFGKDLGEAIAMGPSRLVGVNFQRVGSQDIIPFTKLLSDKRELKDMLEGQAVDLMGPVIGGSFDILNGAKKMMDGDVVAGLKQALPLAVRGLPKAYEMGSGFATDTRGNRIPVNFNSWDVLNQALGYAPPKLAERQAALYTINTRNRRLQMAMSSIRDDYYRALERDDAVAIRKALIAVNDWNRQHPDLPILGSTLAQGVRRREKVFYTGQTFGPGVGVVSVKNLPKLDIAKWANVGGLE